MATTRSPPHCQCAACRPGGRDWADRAARYRFAAERSPFQAGRRTVRRIRIGDPSTSCSSVRVGRNIRFLSRRPYTFFTPFVVMGQSESTLASGKQKAYNFAPLLSHLPTHLHDNGRRPFTDLFTRRTAAGDGLLFNN